MVLAPDSHLFLLTTNELAATRISICHGLSPQKDLFKSYPHIFIGIDFKFGNAINLRRHRYHCLFPGFTYRHKFTTFVITNLGTENFAANRRFVVTSLDAENHSVKYKACDWKSGRHTDRV